MALAGQQKTLLDTIAALAAQEQGLLSAIGTYTAGTKSGVDTSAALLAAINGLSGVQRDQLVALNNQFRLDAQLTIGGRQLNNNMVTALNKIVFNTALTDPARNAGLGTYATGGWVSGPGSATSDSVRAMLSNGEFVVNAASARVAAPWLEAINDNPGAIPAMPVPVPVPVAAAGGGVDIGALLAELRALRAESRAQAEMIGRLTKQAGDMVAGRVEGATQAVEDGNADRRKAQRDNRTAGRSAQATLAA